MKKVESYREVSDAVLRHFVRGAVTNCFLSKDDYEREIKDGTLFLAEKEDSLFFLREREGFRRLNFYLNSPDVPLSPFPADTVCEIPYRDRDEGLKAVSRRMQDTGAKKLFSRIRMTGKAGEHTPSERISPAVFGEFAEVRALLEGAFDRRTGCLPTAGELRDDIAAGRVFVYRQDGIKGLLHFTEEKNTTELRHLAVDGRVRGQGVGSTLVETYLAVREGRARVWVRDDNTPALRVYEKNGYEPDGMKSDVLLF